MDELRKEAARLRAELEAETGDPGARAEYRERLIALGREIDRRIGELEDLRESLRPVAARYRALYRESAAPPRRIDHLAAASHRERGWSALATGEVEEAIASLRLALERDPDDG